MEQSGANLTQDRLPRPGTSVRWTRSCDLTPFLLITLIDGTESAVAICQNDGLGGMWKEAARTYSM
jgi:hypothetical protein